MQKNTPSIRSIPTLFGLFALHYLKLYFVAQLLLIGIMAFTLGGGLFFSLMESIFQFEAVTTGVLGVVMSIASIFFAIAMIPLVIVLGSLPQPPGVEGNVSFEPLEPWMIFLITLLIFFIVEKFLAYVKKKERWKKYFEHKVTYMFKSLIVVCIALGVGIGFLALLYGEPGGIAPAIFLPMIGFFWGGVNLLGYIILDSMCTWLEGGGKLQVRYKE